MPGLVNAMRRAVMQSKKTRYRIAKESGVSAPQLCRLVHGQGRSSSQHGRKVGEIPESANHNQTDGESHERTVSYGESFARRKRYKASHFRRQ